jgi:hypothetical protein
MESQPASERRERGTRSTPVLGRRRGKGMGYRTSSPFLRTHILWLLTPVAFITSIGLGVCELMFASPSLLCNGTKVSNLNLLGPGKYPQCFETLPDTQIFLKCWQPFTSELAYWITQLEGGVRWDIVQGKKNSSQELWFFTFYTHIKWKIAMPSIKFIGLDGNSSGFFLFLKYIGICKFRA